MHEIGIIERFVATGYRGWAKSVVKHRLKTIKKEEFCDNMLQSSKQEHSLAQILTPDSIIQRLGTPCQTPMS